MRTQLLTIVFVLGLALGIIVGESSLHGSVLGVASLLLFLFQIALYYLFRKKGSSIVLLVTAILSFSFFIGITRVQFVQEKPPLVCESVCDVKARVVTSPEQKDTYQVFDVEIKEKDVLRIRVRTPLYPVYEIGDELTLSGKVRTPETFYPHEGARSFDYKKYLELKKVGSEMYYPKVTEMGRGELSFGEHLVTFKDALVGRVHEYVSPPASSLASGMLFGNSDLPKENLEAFRVSGLSHVIVLSGFNIAILISVLFLLLGFLPLTIRVAISSAAIVLFVLMVGGEASIIRATLMAFVSLLALLVGRSYEAKQALFLSLIIIMLYNPHALLSDTSLHLSFLATAGIVYMCEKMRGILSRLHPYLREIISTSISAYLATLPYVLYAFGSASVYAIFANILVVPLVPIMMLLTGVTVLLSLFNSFAAQLSGYTVTFMGDFILWVASRVSSLPFANVATEISFKAMLILYATLSLLYVFLVTRKRDETRITNEKETVSPIISY